MKLTAKLLNTRSPKFKTATLKILAGEVKETEFYEIAATAMRAGVKTFEQFLAKVREELGDRFQDFIRDVGGYPALRPVWDAVMHHDEDDLKNSLEDLRVSPRKPFSKAKDQSKIENVFGPERLQPGLEVLARDPEMFKHQVDLMLKYPEFRGIKGKNDMEKAKQIIEHIKDNLLWLYNKWNPAQRDRSKQWYVGGNRIVHRWAKTYGVPPQAVAGVLAALSPQKDWFQNVTMAQRVITAYTQMADHPWDDKMTQTFINAPWAKGSEDPSGEEGMESSKQSAPKKNPAPKKAPAPQADPAPKKKKPAPMDFFNELKGKTLKELGDNAYLRAVWIRCWDSTYNKNGARIVSPEGEFGDWAKSKGGEIRKMSPNSFSELSKAITILDNPTLENISDVIGSNHKVRSFYNNLVAPLSQGGDVTIDTHAVAAGLLRPLGSNTQEVLHNFGSAIKGTPGPGKSAITGATGLYGFYAEAYREAAKEAGVQPREMQSITWEAIRTLFKPHQRRDKKFIQDVEGAWGDYASGKSDRESVRNRIHDQAGGIDHPDWVLPNPGDSSAERDKSY